MKTALLFLVIVNAVTCNKPGKMKNDFNTLLSSQEKLDLYQLQYGQPADSSFYEGYGVLKKLVAGKKDIRRMAAIMSDSANFLQDRSKNCVLAASFGFKLSSDSVQYVVFIGKAPCMKVLILNETKNTEIIYDLTAGNALVPFLDSAFARKAQ